VYLKTIYLMRACCHLLPDRKQQLEDTALSQQACNNAIRLEGTMGLRDHHRRHRLPKDQRHHRTDCQCHLNVKVCNRRATTPNPQQQEPVLRQIHQRP
jgi:hypothetical protein